jgi:hypothetical protein
MVSEDQSAFARVDRLVAEIDAERARSARAREELAAERAECVRLEERCAPLNYEGPPDRSRRDGLVFIGKMASAVVILFLLAIVRMS